MEEKTGEGGKRKPLKRRTSCWSAGVIYERETVGVHRVSDERASRFENGLQAQNDIERASLRSDCVIFSFLSLKKAKPSTARLVPVKSGSGTELCVQNAETHGRN
jgi:hypothetical protein